MEELKYIIFRLGSEKYGMKLGCVNGIEQEYRIIPVPNAPEGIIGIINLRGEVIPVYSLKERFKFVDDPAETSRSLLVTFCAGTMIAYEVDEVLGIELMDPKNIVPMPNVASNEETAFMENVLRINKDVVIVINVDKVISDEMKEALEKMIAEQ